MTTEAGKALLRWWSDADPSDFGVETMIAAIEAEAREQGFLAGRSSVESDGTRDAWEAAERARVRERVVSRLAPSEAAAVLAILEEKPCDWCDDGNIPIDGYHLTPPDEYGLEPQARVPCPKSRT